jgi:hypothetical protein
MNVTLVRTEWQRARQAMGVESSDGDVGAHAELDSQTGRGLRVAASPLLLNGTGSCGGKAQTRLTVSHQELAKAHDTSLTLD